MGCGSLPWPCHCPVTKSSWRVTRWSTGSLLSILGVFVTNLKLLQQLANCCCDRSSFKGCHSLCCIDVAETEAFQKCPAIVRFSWFLVGSTMKHESIWIRAVLCKCLFPLHILTLWKGKLTIMGQKLFVSHTVICWQYQPTLMHYFSWILS